MSSFWSGWIIFFVLLNWGLVTALFFYATRVKIPTQADGTSGHVWAHGVLREGVRRLPTWWIVLSVGSLLFAIGYLYLYPGFGSHSGSLGWTAEKEVAEKLQANREKQARLLQKVRTQNPVALARDPEVVAAAAILFEDNCASCHGLQGQGNQAIGAPNLADGTWLHGGGDAIRHSIEAGRHGVMPPFGSSMSDLQIHEVAEYVYTLNGRTAPHKMLLPAGKKRFEMTCAACHGADGSGNTALGAPDLTDDDWLYGDSIGSIMATVRHGRTGVMPAWGERLSQTDISMLLAWIHAARNKAAKDNDDNPAQH